MAIKISQMTTNPGGAQLGDLKEIDRSGITYNQSNTDLRDLFNTQLQLASISQVTNAISTIGADFFNANIVTHDLTPLQLTQPLANIQVITLTNTGTLKLPAMNGQTPSWKGRNILVFNNGDQNVTGATEYNIYAQDGTTVIYPTLQYQKGVLLHCTDDSTANGTFTVTPIPNGRFRRFIQDGGAIDTTFLGCVCESSLPGDAYTAPAIGTAGMYTGFNFILKNNSTTNITFTPTGNTIDGASVLILLPTESAWIFCNGSAWETISLSKSLTAGNQATFASVTLKQPVGYTGGNAITGVVGVQTTDATQTVMASIVVSASQSITLSGTITGAQSDHSNAIGGNYTIVARRTAAGNVTLVGSVITNVESSSAATFTCGVDTGTQTVRILVTGIAATTYNWVTHYTYQKVLLNT